MKYLGYEIVVLTDLNSLRKRVEVYDKEGEKVYKSEEFFEEYTALELSEARFWIIDKDLT